MYAMTDFLYKCDNNERYLDNHAGEALNFDEWKQTVAALLNRSSSRPAIEPLYEILRLPLCPTAISLSCEVCRVSVCFDVRNATTAPFKLTRAYLFVKHHINCCDRGFVEQLENLRCH